jgi:di/tricarboxylate transporter
LSVWSFCHSLNSLVNNHQHTTTHQSTRFIPAIYILLLRKILSLPSSHHSHASLLLPTGSIVATGLGRLSILLLLLLLLLATVSALLPPKTVRKTFLRV